jgi:hypothetical protein
MFRFYLHLTIILFPLFVLLAITMSVIGSTQPIHPALRGFVEGCENIPQPCWYGIALGRMTVQEAEPFLEHAHDLLEWQCQMDYFPSRFDDPVYIQLDCPNLKIGDLISVMGEPTSIYVSPYWPAELNFLSGTATIGTGSWTSFQSPVYRMQIFANNAASFFVIDGFIIDWHGIVNNARYCQLEPEYALSFC